MTKMHFFIDGENFRLVAEDSFRNARSFELDPMKFADEICKELGYEKGEVYYYSSSLPSPETRTYKNTAERDWAIKQYQKRGAHMKIALQHGVHYFAPRLKTRHGSQGESVFVQKQVDMAMGTKMTLVMKDNPEDAFFMGTWDTDFLPVLFNARNERLLIGEQSSVFVPNICSSGKSKRSQRPITLQGVTKTVSINEEQYLGFRANGKQWYCAMQSVQDKWNAHLAKENIDLSSLVEEKVVDIEPAAVLSESIEANGSSTQTCISDVLCEIVSALKKLPAAITNSMTATLPKAKTAMTGNISNAAC